MTYSTLLGRYGICDQHRVNSECAFYGRTDYKDFDFEGEINGNKKASLSGLVEQNEMNNVSETFQAQRILVNLMILIEY